MRDDIEAVIDRRWPELGAPGTWWTGEERVAIAAVCRAARSAQSAAPGVLPAVAEQAAHKIACEAHTIDGAWVTACHDRGLAPLALVELMSIVARVSAIDTCLEGLGESVRPLPAPAEGAPSRERPRDARVDGGWLPTVGRAAAPVCMSAVPAEHDAWEDLHAHLYLGMEEMRDLDIDKGLHRSQMELLAARTSLYNDCFY